MKHSKRILSNIKFRGEGRVLKSGTKKWAFLII